MTKLEAMKLIIEWAKLQKKGRSRTTEVFCSPASVRRLEYADGWEVRKHTEDTLERQYIYTCEIKFLKVVLGTRLGRLFS